MNKFNGLMVLSFLLSTLSAQAGLPGFKPVPTPVPSPSPVSTRAPEACWPGENTPKAPVVDGMFGIYLDGSQLSGKEVVQAIVAVNHAANVINDGAHYEDVGFSGTEGYDHLSAAITAQKRKGESRAQLIERADAAIRELQKVNGITVECEGRMFPQGGVSGSN